MTVDECLRVQRTATLIASATVRPAAGGYAVSADPDHPGLYGPGLYVFVTRLCGGRLNIRLGRADPVTRQGRLRRYVVTGRGRGYDTLPLGRVGGPSGRGASRAADSSGPFRAPGWPSPHDKG